MTHPKNPTLINAQK